MIKQLFISLLLVFCSSFCVYGADTGLLEIDDIPTLEAPGTALRAKAIDWDGQGRIDSIHQGRIVINDTDFKLGAGLKIIGMDGKPFSMSLSKNLFVYYLLKGDTTIIKMAADPLKKGN